MNRELSKDKNQLVNNYGKRRKNNPKNSVNNSNANPNKISFDLIDILKNNIQIALNSNVNLYQKNNHNNILNDKENFPTEDYFDLKVILNKLDKRWYKKEYLDYVIEINNNLKEFILKPKYDGIDLQIILEPNCDETKKEIKKGKKSLKITNDPLNDNLNISKFLETEKIKKLNSIAEFKLITPIEIFYKHEYEKFHKISNELDKCSICLFEFYDEFIEKNEKLINNDNSNSTSDILKANKCSKTAACEELIKYQIDNNFFDVVLLNGCSDHFFHIDCFLNMIGDEKQYAKCPNCNTIYGIMIGDQPPGTMKVTIEKNYKCDGYKRNNTLIIEYIFLNGKNYEGTSRTAYLPDNYEGREILALFRVAFERKLLFSIGTSVTTGKSNQTIWNGIHQKTNLTGGSQYFGYPDKTYFNRVKLELVSKGVIKQHIEKNELLSDIADKFIKEKIFSNLCIKKNNSR